MKLKKLVLSIFVGVAALSLAACSSSTAKDGWSTYKKDKTITIGFDNTFVPMGFKNKDGKNVGFDIDLANAVFKKYGIKVKWQAINWDLKETELKNKKIDMIWNGYSKTSSRAKKVLFTIPYMKNEQVLVTKKSSNITKVSQMKGKTLGAQSGSAGYDDFTAHPKVLKDIVKGGDATQYETFNEALIDLENNRINGLLIDRVYANYYLKQEGKLDDYNIIQTGYPNETFAVGVRKSDKTLAKKVNKAFRELYQSGEFQKISDKWFGQDVATDAVKK